MTDQPHTGPMQDAAKRRREYLRKKAWATCVMTVIVFLCAAGALIAWNALFHKIPIGNPVPLIVCVVFLAAGMREVGRINSMTKAIPYVPSVAEQLANLPAKENLLRGAKPPSDSPKELVRAATFNEVAPGIELLRAAEGESNRTEQPVGSDTR